MESTKSGFFDHSEGNSYFQNLQYVQFWCCREYVLRKISKSVGLKIPVINKSTFDHVKLAVYGLSPQSSDHKNMEIQRGGEKMRNASGQQGESERQ